MAETKPFSALKMFRLDGEAAMITGAGAGLGRIAALTLAEAGAQVAVTDIDLNAAERVKSEINAAGGQALTWRLDVGDEAQIIGAVEAIAAAFGRIDILINNAGVAQRDPTEAMPTAAWHRVIDLNATATFLCTREVGKHMLAQGGGRILNLASIMGVVGGGFYPNLPYHAAKGAIVNMTRALAAEWARRGVRVNAIAPTFTRTALTTRLQNDPEMVRIIEERTPMGRFAEPEEMAGAILYLCSPASSMVTGQILAIDGGWTAI